MNCPGHILVYQSRQRSYRELPLRFYELGTVYRYERAGTLHGLMRIRGFTQDDSHIFCSKEQMHDELRSLLTFVLDLLRDYGLTDFYLELSTKPQAEGVLAPMRDGEQPPRGCVRRPRRHGSVQLVSGRGRRPCYGPRSVCTCATRSGASGSSPRSSTTSTCPSASSSSTSGPTTNAIAR